MSWKSFVGRSDPAGFGSEQQTDEPKEKVDTKILETLVQMDPGTELPVGLRVDAYIETAPR